MLQKILIAAAISLLVAFQAWKKGRVPVLWCLFAFAAGMYRPFYAIFPLILILMLPPLKSDELTPPDDDSQGGNNQAEQAAGANDATGGGTGGMGTTGGGTECSTGGSNGGLSAPGYPGAPPDIPASPPVEVETFPVLGDGTWYLASGGYRSGPYTEDAVIEMLRRGKIKGDTYAWSRGMRDWMRARDLGNFRAYS